MFGHADVMRKLHEISDMLTEDDFAASREQWTEIIGELEGLSVFAIGMRQLEEL